jgi:hypothetical protein
MGPFRSPRAGMGPVIPAGLVGPRVRSLTTSRANNNAGDLSSFLKGRGMGACRHDNPLEGPRKRGRFSYPQAAQGALRSPAVAPRACLTRGPSQDARPRAGVQTLALLLEKRGRHSNGWQGREEGSGGADMPSATQPSHRANVAPDDPYGPSRRPGFSFLAVSFGSSVVIHATISSLVLRRSDMGMNGPPVS